MEVIVIPNGPLEENCYIVADFSTKKALLVDPGDDPQIILGMIHSLGLDLSGILLTHAHGDHIGAVDALLKEYDVNVYIHGNESYLLAPASKADSVFPGLQKMPAHIVDVKEGEFKAGDFDVEAYFAPGHSAGSTMYRIGNSLFTGDVLFQGSIGRTDLPTGDSAQMKETLEAIKKMPDQYVVYPGHGPSSTLGYEKAHNPYLLYALI